MRRVVYILLVITMLGLLARMNLVTLPLIKADAQGMPPFDLRLLGYSEAEARAFLGALGPLGHKTYLGAQHTLDTIYPPLMALVLIWTYLALLPRRWALAGCGLALLGAGVDLAENARVTVLLTTAAPSADLIQAASRATLAKTVIVSAALLLAGISFALAVIRWLGRR